MKPNTVTKDNMNIIQPSQITTSNQNIGTSDPPVIQVTLTWDLRGKQNATLQQTNDGVTYFSTTELVGGGSHSFTIPLNSNIWYRVVAQ